LAPLPGAVPDLVVYRHKAKFPHFAKRFTATLESPSSKSGQRAPALTGNLFGENHEQLHHR
jgi:hypothetical protein